MTRPPQRAKSEASAEIVRDKIALRANMKARRAAIPPAERRARSLTAAGHLRTSRLWQQARSVALFCSMADEIETASLLHAIWNAGRLVALPVAPPLGTPLAFRWVAEDTELVRSRYGALEPGPAAAPAGLSDLDLLVIPGLAFDERGARLGYGGAYYDRTLANASASAVMLSFACQQVPAVPEEPHDRRVTGVVTELGWAV